MSVAERRFDGTNIHASDEKYIIGCSFLVNNVKKHINPEYAAKETLIKLVENASRDLKIIRDLRLMTDQEELAGELDALETIEVYLATILRSIHYRRSEHFDEEQQYVTPLDQSQMEHLIAMAPYDEPEGKGRFRNEVRHRRFSTEPT